MNKMNKMNKSARPARISIPATTVLLVLLFVFPGQIIVAASSHKENNAAPSSPSSTRTPACDGRMAFVTGGTGRTGQQVVSNLLRDGFCVRVLTRNVARATQIFSTFLLSNDDQLKNDENKSRPPALLELASGGLGDGVSVKAAFVPRGTSGFATISHVLFLARGEVDAVDDYALDAVHHRGVAECTQQAVRAKATSMVVISSAGVTKPYGVTSLLENSLYFAKLPMAQRRKGEMYLQRQLARSSSLNYVILRPGALVSDESYPNSAPKGVSITQSDKSMPLFGSAMNHPGMSRSMLGEAVLSAMQVHGHYTVEVTSGSTPIHDISVYESLSQDHGLTSLPAPGQALVTNIEIAERLHREASREFQFVLVSWTIGAVAAGYVLGAKRAFMLAAVAMLGMLWYWSRWFLDISLAELQAALRLASQGSNQSLLRATHS